MVGQDAFITVYILASGRNGTWKLQLIEAENPEWRDLSDPRLEVPDRPLSRLQRP